MSTIPVTYSIEDIRDEEAFSEPVVTNEHTYTRTDHGSPLGLMADAALTNHQIGGAPGERCSPLWDHVGPDVDRDDVEAQDDCLG